MPAPDSAPPSNGPQTASSDPEGHPDEDEAEGEQTSGTTGAQNIGNLGETGQMEAAVEQARKDAAEHYARYLRAVADLENFRKRTIREKDELRQYATSRLLEDLIPVLDNLALGLAATKAPNADVKTLVGGVELVLNQARTTLAQHGLKEINPVGQPFDPNQHESISAQPSSTVPEGSVAVVVRTGYSLNSRLLRPASVVVSSGPEKSKKTSS